MNTSADSESLDRLPLEALRPFFSVTILECVAGDVDSAYDTLIRYLRSEADRRGQAIGVQVLAEAVIGGPRDEPDDGTGDLLDNLGLDRFYGVSRVKNSRPPWIKGDSLLVDTVHELTVALRRNRLVAVRSDIVSTDRILRWADKPTTPYKPLVPEVLNGTFDGDGRTVWLQSVQRQRSTRPNSKSQGGSRLQDAFDAGEDFSYSLSAMRVEYIPAEAGSHLDGILTVSPEKSHLSYKAMGLPDFLAAVDEALGMLEKSIADENPPEPILPGYATREKDLSRVNHAYEIRVASPDEVFATSNSADAEDAAQLLRESLLDVDGKPGSAAAVVVFGQSGSVEGRLTLRPLVSRAGFDLNVTLPEPPKNPDLAQALRTAIQDHHILSIYYESGHVYNSRQISRQNLQSHPFRIDFADFSDYDIMREKPRVPDGYSLHDAIGQPDDKSLFAWVVDRYATGWLLCDDGAGEIADFLHLDEDGTLTAIHVKAAHNSSQGRRIAVTRYEELVSQTEKNVKRLMRENLEAELTSRRGMHRACWYRGSRGGDVEEMGELLGVRSETDKTYVTLVQPHLLKKRYDDARGALASGEASQDSFSLRLLDNLLHSTRRTVTSHWDDLRVIGAT